MDTLNQNGGTAGFSIIEILIAMAIAVIVMSGVVASSGGFGATLRGYQSTIMNGQTNAEAVAKAQQVLEQTQSFGRQDFNLVNPTATTSLDGFYYKSVDVQLQPDFLTKLVTTTISWLTDHNATSTVRLSTLVTNLGNVNAPYTCNSTLRGDWKAPLMHSWEFGKDLVGDASSGFPIGGIDVLNGKLYVVINNSNGNNFPTFFTFDVSGTEADPSLKPVLKAQIDNDVTVKSGLSSVRVAGTYAYVATATNFNYTTCTSGACGQLQVIDVSDISNPIPKSKFKMPGVTGKNGQSIGQTIFYKDGYVYLGLAKTQTGPEFNIIDVGGGGGGTPESPKWVGGYQVGNGINAIYVRGRYAYLATPNNTELTILDIDNPASPVPVGSYDAPDNQGNGKSVFIVGNTLYFGRTVTAANPELYVLNDSNPEAPLPAPLGTREVGSSVNGILVRDYLAFLLTNNTFQILNISNSAAMYEWATPINLPGNSSGSTIECEGNNIFFGSIPSSGKGYIALVTPGP